MKMTIAPPHTKPGLTDEEFVKAFDEHAERMLRRGIHAEPRTEDIKRYFKAKGLKPPEGLTFDD